MTWQLMNYVSGQDSTIVEFREFNKDKTDVYPNIGICFSRFFYNDKLINYGKEWNFNGNGRKKNSKTGSEIN